MEQWAALSFFLCLSLWVASFLCVVFFHWMNSWSEQDRSVESFILKVAFMFFFPEWKGEQSEHPFKSHYTVTMPISLSLSQIFLTHTSLQSVYWMESTWTRVSVLFSDLSFTAQRWPFFLFHFYSFIIDSFSMWAIQLQKRWKKIEYFFLCIEQYLTYKIYIE